MASTSSPLVELLKKAFPSAVPAVEGSGDMATAKLIKSVYPEVEYSENEKTEINQWVITSNHIASPGEDTAKTSERLSSLNTHLSSRTTVLGSKPSIADIALYSRLAPVVSKWSAEERTGEQGYHHIVRHVNFVQNAPLFGLKIEDSDKINIAEDDVLSPIKPVDPKAEKERKKKEKEAAAAAATPSAPATTTATEKTLPIGKGKDKENAESKKSETEAKSTGDVIAVAVGGETAGVAQPSAGFKTEKKEKKEKAPKQPKAPPPAKDKPLSPCLIDLRVGHILKAIAHPNADSLFVSTIACGDAPGTENTSEYEGQVVRTVCSGLNGLIPLEEMQNRKIIAVCNLKPVTMRGIKSAAMVLAASPRLAEGEVDNHAGPVELVNPPAESKAGDRVYFEGWEGEPDAVLNPKKKVWEMCQVGFTTTNGLEVGFDAGAVEQLEGKSGVSKLMTKDGLCKVSTLKGATVR